MLEDGPSYPSPEETLTRAQIVRGVEEAIAALDADFREVLLLRDLEGLSGPEVAARLGITLAAMKTRLHRARNGVRARLGPRSPG